MLTDDVLTLIPPATIRSTVTTGKRRLRMQGWPSIVSSSIVMRSCTCALTGDHPNSCVSVPTVAVSTVG